MKYEVDAEYNKRLDSRKITHIPMFKGEQMNPNEGIEKCVGISREKHWSEQVTADKVERTRLIVKELIREVNRLGEVVRNMEKHTHGAKGELLLPYPGHYPEPETSILSWPLRQIGKTIETLGRNCDDVYF